MSTIIVYFPLSIAVMHYLVSLKLFFLVAICFSIALIFTHNGFQFSVQLFYRATYMYLYAIIIEPATLFPSKIACLHAVLQLCLVKLTCISLQFLTELLQVSILLAQLLSSVLQCINLSLQHLLLLLVKSCHLDGAICQRNGSNAWSMG